MNQFEIKSDALGVIDRIKAWNSKYSVFYNKNKNKFELYLTQTELAPKQYCLTFPNLSIDERMIEHMLKSEIQNRKVVLEEIEKNNNSLLKNEQKNLIKKLENQIESKRNT